MRKPSLFLVTLISFLAFAFSVAISQEEPAKPEPIAMEENPVVLTVDGTPIMANDVREMMMARFGQQMQQMPPEQLAMVQQQIQNMIIGDLVSKTLLLNAADEKGYQASDDDIAESMKEITDRLPEGTTLEQMAAQTGVSLDRIRKQISDDAKIRQLVDEVTKDIQEPNGDEVKKYYEDHPDEFKKEESVQASHILVSTQGITDQEEIEAALASIEDLRKQLLESEAEFAALAEEHSDCPSKAQGGDLGQFGKGQMVPEFEKAAFEQEIGKVGETVKTQFGYHLIMVTDRQEAEEVPFPEVEEDLKSNLYEKAKGDKVNAFIEELQSKAKIEQPGVPAPEETPAAEEAPAAEETPAPAEEAAE
ncbi:MAG: peptidylprolyl isomerase [Verrucomicrobiota bacterium]